MTRILGSRWAGWLVDWVLAVVIARLVADPLPGRTGRDLEVYYTASALLWRGGLYDFTNWRGLGFTYPPFSAVLLSPVGWISWDVAVGLMTAVVGAVMVVVVHTGLYAVRRGPVAADAPRWLWSWWTPRLVTALAAASVIGLDNMHWLNVSLVVTAMVVVDALAPIPPRWRGVLTGLAAAVKITPLAFVVLFAITGRVRAAVVSLVVFGSTVVLGWVLLPSESNGYWTGLLWDPERVGNLALRANTSFAGIFVRAGIDDYHLLWLVCSGLAGLASCVVAVLAWRGGDRLAGVVVIGMMTATVPGVTWSHHWGWAIGAGILTAVLWGWGWGLLWATPFLAIHWVRTGLTGALPEPGWAVGVLGGWPALWYVGLLVALLWHYRPRATDESAGRRLGPQTDIAATVRGQGN